VELDPWPANRFILAWFPQGSSAQAWGEAWTGHIGRPGWSPSCSSTWRARWSVPASTTSCSKIRPTSARASGGSTEIYLKNAIAVPRQDPVGVAALMTR
jgi:hypothetical protein